MMLRSTLSQPISLHGQSVALGKLIRPFRYWIQYNKERKLIVDKNGSPNVLAIVHNVGEFRITACGLPNHVQFSWRLHQGDRFVGPDYVRMRTCWPRTAGNEPRMLAFLKYNHARHNLLHRLVVFWLRRQFRLVGEVLPNVLGRLAY